MSVDVSGAEAGAGRATSWEFGTAAVRRWANYSGDFNPIHFDAAAARRMGADSIVVHGMLAALPLKQAAWDAYPGVTSGWVKNRTLFRNPMPQDRMIVLERLGAGRTGCRAGDGCGHEYFRSACSAAEAPAALADDAQGWLLAGARVREFAGLYPDWSAPWIALDAAIFAEFMQHRLELVYAHVERQRGNAGAPGPRPVIVHLSHTVEFDPDAVASVDLDRLSYGLCEPELISSPQRIVCTIPIWVKSQRQHIMSVYIAVIAIISEQ